MRWYCLALTIVVTFGWCANQKDVLVPPPDRQLSVEEAKRLYNSFVSFLGRYPYGVPLPLPREWIEVLERLLMDFPDERFYYIPRGLGLPERVERAYVRSWLSASYRAEGKVYESVVLDIQDFLIGWIDYEMMKSGLLYGYPSFPYPDPFRGDPPTAVLRLAEHIKNIQVKGVQLSPVVFANSWPLRVRWKGNDINDALISLNDLAYGLGKERWREILQRDYKAWRFVLSVKGKTITFTKGGRKAVIEGKEVILRYPVERSFYDLYVPLDDLVKVLGGTVRPPKPDELVVFQRYLPVSLLVVDLD